MDKYTKFILTVIAIAMIGILFKGEKIITSAHAIESHQHRYQDIYGKGGDFIWLVKEIIMRDCQGKGHMRSGYVFSHIRCAVAN